MALFRRTPTPAARRISRLCFATWGRGCSEHGGGAHRCVRAWRHSGSHECSC